jgi:hypothetical protein
MKEQIYKGYKIVQSFKCYNVRDSENYLCTIAKTIKETKAKINKIIECGYC